MELLEIVMKLTGPVQPAGESNEDEKRLRNIKVLTNLVDRLLSIIHDAADCADSHEASVKVIGEHARKFLKDVRET